MRLARGSGVDGLAAIEAVTLQKGDERPIRICIDMSNSAGVFQVDELLKRKLREPYWEGHERGI